jgi:preprotein translocase subunit SecE
VSPSARNTGLAADSAVETSVRSAKPAKKSKAEHQKSRGGVIGFLQSVWAELQRVDWPTRQQVGTYTWVVLFFVIIAGVYLGLLDTAFAHLVNWLD